MADNNQQEKYPRLYLTKFREELQKHNIDEDVNSFINRAFYKLLDKKIEQKKGGNNDNNWNGTKRSV